MLSPFIKCQCENWKGDTDIHITTITLLLDPHSHLRGKYSRYPRRMVKKGFPAFFPVLFMEYPHHHGVNLTHLANCLKASPSIVTPRLIKVDIGPSQPGCCGSNTGARILLVASWLFYNFESSSASHASDLCMAKWNASFGGDSMVEKQRQKETVRSHTEVGQHGSRTFPVSGSELQLLQADGFISESPVQLRPGSPHTAE